MAELRMSRRSWTCVEIALPSGSPNEDLDKALKAAADSYCQITGYDKTAVLPEGAFTIEARGKEIVISVLMDEHEPTETRRI